MLASGKNQIFPLRGYTAETYAKVMGSSCPSQPSLKPASIPPLVLLMDRGGWVFFTPYRLYHKPPLRGGSVFCGCVSPLEKFGLPRLCERVGSMVARREVMHHPGPSRWLPRSARAAVYLRAQGCRVSRREGSMTHAAVRAHAASVRSMRPSLQLERST